VAHRELDVSIQFLRGYSLLPELDEVAEDKPGRRIITRYTPLGQLPNSKFQSFTFSAN
jgi:hypothetical protein